MHQVGLIPTAVEKHRLGILPARNTAQNPIAPHKRRYCFRYCWPWWPGYGRPNDVTHYIIAGYERGPDQSRTDDGGFANRPHCRKSPQKDKTSGQVVSILGSSQNVDRLQDPDLMMIGQCWADLPAAIRAGIVAMVRAAGGA